ncbi:hypothetical protein FNV43_RR01328 [Rhamnella rubrinervis]|uniref:Uncharacterized protein n=1 Tax=Rhamnella rubrinervis TaxID=2594499 RepID=A0A8K0HSC8_9ROSA|nr:hypothetical protein FNV43_RR01328 [Rhamnella rubrinervis]
MSTGDSTFIGSLLFASFLDGLDDDGFKPGEDFEFYMIAVEAHSRDLPSFYKLQTRHCWSRIFKAQFEMLDKESKPKVLVNTFDALEPEALRAIGGNKLDLIESDP